MRWPAGVLLCACACACPSKQSAGGGTTTGSGSATGSGSGAGVGTGSGAPVAAACAAVRGQVEGLYRAEAQAKEPTRVAEATADNTAMVLRDCNADPGRVSACLQAARTVPAIEACLPPLDDEGSEGDSLAR